MIEYADFNLLTQKDKLCVGKVVEKAQILKIDVALAAVTSGGGKAPVCSVLSSLFSRRLLWCGSFRALVGTPDFSGQSSQQLETQEEQQLASLSKVVLADT